MQSLQYSKDIARFEALAEEAYSAMYDARHPKDFAEDALMNMQRAIDIALEIGFQDEADRLTKRRDHIKAVYDHQFRWLK